jgi:hypothetical protein
MMSRPAIAALVYADGVYPDRAGRARGIIDWLETQGLPARGRPKARADRAEHA